MSLTLNKNLHNKTPIKNCALNLTKSSPIYLIIFIHIYTHSSFSPNTTTTSRIKSNNTNTPSES